MRKIMNLIEDKLEEARIKGGIPRAIVLSEETMELLKEELSQLRLPRDTDVMFVPSMSENPDVMVFMNLPVLKTESAPSDGVGIVQEGRL